MAERPMAAIMVPADKPPKKPDDEKPKIGVKKPKKKTDLMDLDIKKKKEEGDFSAVVDKAIPEQVALAKSGKVSEAIENLYALEKQCRNGGDAFSTAKVVTCIVELLWESNDFKGLIENLQMLAKKRGQLKQAVTSMVQKAVTFVDRLSIDKELDKKLELIDTLRTISEGKIYVENERARLTMILAKIRESQGKIKEAADIMQEVQVETYGSMEKREKTEFILEQVRLCLDSGDFIRGQIISRKINTRVLSEDGFEDLKLTYYTLMVRYWTQQTNYLEIAKAYQAMYDTPKVKSNPDLWKKNLKLLILYLILSPFNNEQSDFINRVQLDKQLEEVPLEQNLVKLFLTKELMQWPKLEQLYKGEFNPLGAKAWEDFHHRVVEHNIRVVASYYTRISMTRLSQLLFLSTAETEKFVSDQVVSKGVFARVDRPRGVINFVKRQEPAEVMDEWAHNVGELLELVEKTCHLIARENMVHAAAEKAAAATKTA